MLGGTFEELLGSVAEGSIAEQMDPVGTMGGTGRAALGGGSQVFRRWVVLWLQTFVRPL